MAEKRIPLFVGVDTVISDLGVSRAKAYDVIKQLNREMKEQYPRAIVVAGKVNRIWYEEACLKTEQDAEEPYEKTTGRRWLDAGIGE